MLARMRLPVIFAVALAVVLGVGLIATLSVRSVLGNESGTLEEGSHLQSEAAISVDEAVAAAQTAASGAVGDVELERNGDLLVYEVEIGETDVHVDATNGDVLGVDDEDGDDGRSDDDDMPLQPGEPAVSVEQAIAAAQEAASGNVGEVELERELDRLVYSIEVGGQEVIVDATDGAVLSVEQDD